ncbi:uncharacterized protein LOC126833393 [Adelges cooleyi]|uniref:uncharacterized protein LOC126833393 n=1 Tax=Adelges cooleyi TaxID=133065 RepID=UPI0021800DD4|nr:uncharacterized protein LOC126833393 [Adelges cooleyi]
MMVNKVLLAAVFVLFGSLFYSKVAGDGDREKVAKLLATSIKCFNKVDLDVCAEMMKGEYDSTQQKYKDCNCAMACVGKDLGFIVDGKPVPENYQKMVSEVQNATIKAELTDIYEKCPDPKGDDECSLSENFMTCALKSSPKLKDRLTAVMKAMSVAMHKS